MEQQRLRIMLLDDERSLREPLAGYLKGKFGFQVDMAADGEEALRLIEDNHGQYDVALIDQLLTPGPHGIEVMRRIKSRYPVIECIIFTGWGTDDRQEALRQGAFRYLEKPFDNEELALLIRTAGQQVRLRAISHAIVSKREIGQVFAQIADAARSLTLADDIVIVVPDKEYRELLVYPQDFMKSDEENLVRNTLSWEIIQNNAVKSVSELKHDHPDNEQLLALGFQSYVGVPIPGEQGNLGVLYAYSKNPNHFDEWGGVTQLQTLAGQAGLAIDNAWAFYELQTRANYTEGLVHFGRQVAVTRSLEEQIRLAADFLWKQLRITTGFIALYDQHRDTLRFPWFYEDGFSHFIPERSLGSDTAQWGLSGFVVKHGHELLWFDEKEKQELGVMPVQVGVACQSGFCLPLRVGGAVIGLISIQSDQPRAYSDATLGIVRALGYQLSAAIENLRLLDRIESLHQVVLEVNKELDPPTILRQVMDQAVKLSAADGGGVYLLDPAGENLTLRVAGSLPRSLEGCCFPKDKGLAGLIVQTGQPQIINDYQAWPERHDFLDEYNLHAVAGVPIRVDGRLLGALMVHKTRAGSSFDSDSLQLLEQFANHVAATLQKSSLVEKLQTLGKLAAEIASSTEMEAILSRACQAGVTLFGVNHSAVVLFEPNGGQGRVMAEFPLDLNTVGTQIPIRGIEIEEELVCRGRHATITDVQDHRSSLGVVAEIFDRFGIQSIALVPIIYQGRVLGSISLDVIGKRREFFPDEIELCKVLADHVAVAVENARLFKETKQANQYMASLFTASSAFVSEQDPQKALEAIVKELCKVVDALWVAALMVDNQNQLQILAQSGAGRELESLGIARPNGISRRVIYSGQARFFPNLEEVKEEIHPSMILDGVKAAACLPLIHDKSRGALWLHFNEIHPFSEAEKQALQIYAAQAASAYDAARRMKHLSQIRQVTERLAKALTPEQALQEIVTSAGTVFQADIVVFWPYSEVHGKFIPEELTTFGLTGQEEAALREAEPKPGPTTHQIMEVGYVAVNDVADPEYRFIGSAARDLLVSLQVKSFQAIVPRVGEEKLGVLFIDYCQARVFDDKDREILHTLASHAALALKTARLLDQQRRIQQTAGVIAEAAVQDSIDETLNVVARSVRQVVEADVVALYAFNEVTQRFDAWGKDIIEQRLASSMTPAHALKLESVTFRMIGIDRPPYYRLAEKDADQDEWLSGRFVKIEGIQAAINFQLRAQGKKVGVMFVNFRSPHRFASDEIATLQLFADLAAGAILSAQLQWAANRRANALNALFQAGEAMTSSLTLEKTLSQIAEQALELMGDQKQAGCASHLALKYGRRLRFEAASSQDTLERLRSKVGTLDLETAPKIGVIGRVALTGVGEVVSYAPDDPDYIPFEPDTLSELAVPIKLEGQVIGIINVEHPEPDAFREEDRQVLESLAAQAAVAIKNARLYEQARFLADISHDVAKSLEVEAFLESLFGRLCQIFKERGIDIHPSLGTFDADSQDLLTYHTNFYPTDVRPDKISIYYSPGIMAWVARNQRAYYAPNVTQDENYNELLEATRSEVAVPIFFGQESLGVLDLESPQIDAFTEDDLALIQTVAHQIATIVHNVRQYEELKQTKGLVGARTAVAWMGMVSAQWRHAVQTDTTTIRDNILLLREDLGAKISEGVARRLVRMEQIAERILAVPINAPLSPEEGVESLAIKRLVGERFSQIQKRPHAEGVVYQFNDNGVDDSVTVRANAAWLKCILDLLVENALNAMSHSPEKQLTLGIERMPGGVKITVEDTGSGIPEAVQKKLFKEPIQKQPGESGLGSGLLMAQTIAQTYKGDVYVKSTGPHGTCMVLKLPTEE